MNSTICASLCTGFKTFIAAPEARIAVITITEGIIADGAMAIRSWDVSLGGLLLCTALNRGVGTGSWIC